MSRISGKNPERLLTVGTARDPTELRGFCPSALSGLLIREGGWIPNSATLELILRAGGAQSPKFTDTACVELRFSDGSICSIDTIAVENEIARNMYERSELDYLIHNDPLAYADLILNGDPEVYLRTVTEYKPLD